MKTHSELDMMQRQLEKVLLETVRSRVLQKPEDTEVVDGLDTLLGCIERLAEITKTLVDVNGSDPESMLGDHKSKDPSIHAARSCPFCGSNKIAPMQVRHNLSWSYVMQCYACKARGPAHVELIHAAEYWNDRQS